MIIIVFWIIESLEKKYPKLYFEIDHEYPILERKFISVSKSEFKDAVSNSLNDIMNPNSFLYKELFEALSNNIDSYTLLINYVPRPPIFGDEIESEFDFFENLYLLCTNTAVKILSKHI